MKRKAMISASVLATASTLISGCSEKSKPPTNAQVSSAVSSYFANATSSLPQCASLVGKSPSVWVKQIAGDSCEIGDTLEGSTYYDCKDGSKLYLFGDPTHTYYGNSKDILQFYAGKSSLDPSTPFGAAYKGCNP